MTRTHMCGELTRHETGQKVTLQGWVAKRRDLGGLIFIDLRDRTGIVQCVFNPERSPEALEIAETVRNEYVVEMSGEVIERDENAVNKNISTGYIEVAADRLEILNESKAPPFMISDDTDASEEIRLKYRYLDLRRPVMHQTFKMRHDITKFFRDFLDGHGFYEIETPMLTKSTPEGARDYLVPSRVHPGSFYALPQSPQIFKQLLMVGGMEKYFQIVRCFRDEDLRADRQPEFTQVDIETAFFEKEPFMNMTETMMTSLVKRIKGKEVPKPFKRLTYAEAMSRYGSDKPDTRFGMELIDLSDITADSDFKVFKQAVANSGQVKALNVEGKAADYSRKQIDELGEFAAKYGAKGLAWMKVSNEGLTGPIAKFFKDEKQDEILQAVEAKEGDLLLFVADKPKVVADALGALRVKLGKELDLIASDQLDFLWITEFPLLAYDEDAGRYVAEHHPFTAPMTEDLEKLATDPGAVRADAYDLVLNGYELGGGSRRIHKKEWQDQMFNALGFSEEEAREQFGFLLEALEYGAPPHGGIALGLDRLVMILAGRHNLRDTIAFPKTASAASLLTNAPGGVSKEQLEELHISINEPKKEQ